MTKRLSPPSSKLKILYGDIYTVGGLICVIGQLIMEWFTALDMPEKVVKAAVLMLIFIAAWLTGLKLFDKIAKHAGAGTLVPITGFANAVVSPAINYKKRGLCFGAWR